MYFNYFVLQVQAIRLPQFPYRLLPSSQDCVLPVTPFPPEAVDSTTITVEQDNVTELTRDLVISWESPNATYGAIDRDQVRIVTQLVSNEILIEDFIVQLVTIQRAVSS